MSHLETVKRETFELLKTLMADRRLANFKLVGGTALALHMGHRLSIDLDLFTQKTFDEVSLEKYLVDRYNFKGDYLEEDTLKGSINGIKIDLITHNYTFVEEQLTTKEGIRLVGIKDIAAMKLKTISDTGTRLKDFIDIAYLSTRLSLSDMLHAYEKKYLNANRIRPLKGLTFFNDINMKEPILMVNADYKWKGIEKRLLEMVKKEDYIFQSLPLDKNNQIGGESLEL